MSKLTPKLPLQLDDDDGAFKMISQYQELAKQNLRNLVLTNPGEKSMDGSFGVGVKRYLFENYRDISSVQSDLHARISEQVARYLSYINVYDLRVTDNQEKGKISVVIYYIIMPLGQSATLDLSYETNNIWS
jgi:phage baseplate assembly protein W